ncbi:hypothetical protein K439DRAFT_1103801 [Ramaria rubella]|nr:hypothetical protein K439DRAFT_1103801 [Ramaria rubella]
MSYFLHFAVIGYQFRMQYIIFLSLFIGVPRQHRVCYICITHRLRRYNALCETLSHEPRPHSTRVCKASEAQIKLNGRDTDTSFNYAIGTSLNSELKRSRELGREDSARPRCYFYSTAMRPAFPHR